MKKKQTSLNSYFSARAVLICLLIFIAQTNTLAQLYFAPRVDYTLPVASTFVDPNYGDFNKDGVPDLVITNFSGGSVTVFIGAGNGTFGSPQNYTTGSGPVGARSFDANNDGNPDLALANFNSNTISVFLGNGTGTFGLHKTFATGSGPQAATHGDFNEDGKIDLAVANWLSNTVSILLGNGDGTFAPPVSYATGTNPLSVVLADLNGDNHLDLALSNENSGNINVRLGTGTGTFGAAQTYTTGSRVSQVAVGDFNRDLILDLAVANINSSTVSILIGTGSGTFNPAVNFSSPGATFIAASDYNADGNLDLFVSNTGNNTVSIYTGSGTGSFSLYQFISVSSKPGSLRLLLLDLNNDGLRDIVTTNDGGNVMGVLLGNVPPGGAGTSLKFNGSNQEAQLGTWFNYQNFTVSMWVNPGATQVTDANIIDNNHTASRSWALQQNGNVVNQYTFGGAVVNLVSNQWQHVALVSNAGTRSIYLNGCLVNSFNSGAITYDGTQSLRLCRFGGGGRFWNGELDEVRFFDSALTDTQIQNTIHGEIPANSPNLVAYYRMNEGSGNSIFDGTTNARTGTLINAPPFQIATINFSSHTLTGFSPSSGSVGTTVMLTGSNFDPVATNNIVKFNGVTAMVTAGTTTSLTTTVPAGATTGKISVAINCVTILSVTDFTVTVPLPTITSFTPTSGPIGTTVTITGTNFSATPANNIVAFNGTPSVVTASTATSITTTVPTGATTGKVSVTVAGNTATSANDFTVTTSGGAVTINTEPLGTSIGGTVTKNLVSLITTLNNNLDINSITVTVQPPSGAVASVTNGVLTVDYTNISFSGKESITIRACDTNGNCATRQFEIEVEGDVIVYNAVSPNGDKLNEFFRLEYIQALSPKNQVQIFNRWGDEVFSISDYDNQTRVFAGLTNGGSKLPAGTYFYKIILTDVNKTLTGFLALK